MPSSRPPSRGPVDGLGRRRGGGRRRIRQGDPVGHDGEPVDGSHLVGRPIGEGRLHGRHLGPRDHGHPLSGGAFLAAEDAVVEDLDLRAGRLAEDGCGPVGSDGGLVGELGGIDLGGDALSGNSRAGLPLGARGSFGRAMAVRPDRDAVGRAQEEAVEQHRGRSLSATWAGTAGVGRPVRVGALALAGRGGVEGGDLRAVGVGEGVGAGDFGGPVRLGGVPASEGASDHRDGHDQAEVPGSGPPMAIHDGAQRLSRCRRLVGLRTQHAAVLTIVVHSPRSRQASVPLTTKVVPSDRSELPRDVPGVGLEPTRPFEQWLLRPPCLPFHHPGGATKEESQGSFLRSARKPHFGYPLGTPIGMVGAPPPSRQEPVADFSELLRRPRREPSRGGTG